MATIIKKGTNASAFVLSNGKTITLYPDILCVLKDDDFGLLMKEYGSFITPRIYNEKSNINGCFMINSDKSDEYLKDMSNEVGSVEDGSAHLNENELKNNSYKNNKKNHK